MEIDWREAHRRLAELVELAAGGQDVFILVDGKVKARLTRVGQRGEDEAPHLPPPDTRSD